MKYYLIDFLPFVFNINKLVFSFFLSAVDPYVFFGLTEKEKERQLIDIYFVKTHTHTQFSSLSYVIVKKREKLIMRMNSYK